VVKSVPNSNYWILAILGFMIVIVAVSGCTNHSEAANFTDGSVSFSYPGDMTNTTSNGNLSGSNWVNIAYIAKSDVYIYVNKNPTLNDQATPRDVINADVQANSGQVLSTTDEVNPNGIEVSRNMVTLTDPSTKILLIYYNFFFKNKSGEVYQITVYGSDSKNSEIRETATQVFNSLKLN
jgi:hypothetical protein